ncbi:hypothetical protein SAY87_019145 [Trapa incisa]|uniref:SAWADEE domain-containing protein n=2 Tax=Trapa TaxID=22665 RepID=A0AAN7R8T5_TRANT|nr:hypothetical protein SAY87_019145 [Trapa incisa]KAK4792455.1 hypothetical protein SAY86_022890 [Trapa natans]
MGHLRPRFRPREHFSGFLKSEIEKMEKMLGEFGPETITRAFCRRIATRFNCSAGRAGKPCVKWTEVQNWFLNRQSDRDADPASSHDLPQDFSVPPGNLPFRKASRDSEIAKGQEVPGVPELEFEAKSSKDGAWYDVDKFLAHRFLSSGEAEVLVRFIGFGADEDEWVNIKKAVRERSIPLEHWECHKLKVGDFVLCFQERREQLTYYDAHIIEIQRRMHDIRGCRCLFLIRYDHDNSEERVRLRRLCCRP